VNTSTFCLLLGWRKFATKTIFAQHWISSYCWQWRATEKFTQNALLLLHCNSGYVNALQCHFTRNFPIPFYNRVNWSDTAISLTDTSIISAFFLSWYVTIIESSVSLQSVPTFPLYTHVITEEYYSPKCRLFCCINP